MALACALSARADVAVPVAGDAAELSRMRERAAASGEVFAANLARATQGLVLEGRPAAALPPGRYRLHIQAAIAPYWDPSIADIAVVVRAGEASAAVSMLDFRAADEFLDASLDFVADGKRTPAISVAWALGEQSKTVRAKSAAAKAALPQQTLQLDGDVDDLLGDGVDLLYADGRMNARDLKEIPFRLVLRAPAIEPLSPLAVTDVALDRVLYEPGSKGMVRIGVRNYGREERGAELLLDCVRELSDAERLFAGDIRVDGQSEKIVEVPFTAAGRMGLEMRATVADGESRHAAAEYCSVADNFWEVGIGYATPVHTHTKKYLEIPATMRKRYSNWIDVFFWAPCDWACLVSPLKRWWSGQCSYPEDEDNLKDLISRCQAQGMKAAAYCSGNAAGPFGWDTARRHPEWFGGGRYNGQYNVEALDHWNDPDWRRQREDEGHPGWFTVRVDLRHEDALHWGIDQIVASAKHYGWDAARFDGHYSILGNDAMSTRNMRRLKERVWRELPGFRLGFNFGRAPEWRGGITHELREAMAGGGLYMQEGIRSWRYTSAQYQSWDHYATNELRIAKRIQELGGTYHCIWSLGQDMSDAQAYYKLVYGLIAGGHPCYGSHDGVRGCANWGAFMTRWSSMLWEPKLRVVRDPDARFAVQGDDRIQWRPFAQERVESPGRKFLVLHLANPPVTDRIADTVLPRPPAEPIVVRMRPEPGTKLVRATLVRPEAVPYAAPLLPEREGDWHRVVVPRMQHWAMLVYELEGSFEAPAAPPRFTEPPDQALVAEAWNRGLHVRPDPNKAEVHSDAQQEAGPGVIVHVLNHGSANIGKPLTLDPESEAGTVQWRDKTKTSARLGAWWFERIPPGEYEVSLRFKWVDPREEPTPQRLDVSVINEEGTGSPELTLVTPGYPDPPEGSVTLGPRGVYRYYPIGRITRLQSQWRDGWQTHVVCRATTTEAGEHTVYLDRIRVEAVAGNTDAALAEYYDLPPKPGGLRVPNGARPGRVLLVKGMFWQQYLAASDLECESGYRLPETHAALYAFDAVVLCNVDLGEAGLPARKRLKDFVEDGGRVVILGGPHTLGQGGVSGTFVDDVLPVACKGPREVVRCEPPLPLSRAPGRRPDGGALLFWRHAVEGREHAEVLAWCGEHPVAFRGTFARGVACVFTGTVLGEGGPDHTPFWQDPAWPALLRRMVME